MIIKIKNYFFVSYYLDENEKRTKLVKARNKKRAIEKFLKKNSHKYIQRIKISCCEVEDNE